MVRHPLPVAAAVSMAALFAVSASTQTFTERSGALGLDRKEASQGVAIGDPNGDGWPDVFISSIFVDNPIPFLPDLGSANRCYLSGGGSSFSDAAQALGLDDSNEGLGAAWSDYDNDGRLDLYVVRGVTSVTAEDHLLLRQRPDGTFDAAPSAWISASEAGRSVCWADYDNDGRLDVFVTNGLDSFSVLPDSRVFLFHQNADGSFTDLAVNLGIEDRRNGHGCAWSDFDDDGDMDLFVANHGFEDPVLGYSEPQPDALYRNQLRETGRATFVDVAPEAGVDGMGEVVPGGGNGGSASFGCAWADFDNDGDMDLFVSTGFAGAVPYPTPDRLYQNKGDGTFFDRTLAVIDPDFGENSYGVNWGDFDNDGDLDLFVTSASVPLIAEATNDYFKNSGWPLYLLTNEESSSGLGVSEWSTASATADLDRNGYLDIYAVNGIPAWELFLERADDVFMNDGGSNHWLQLDLVGVLSNRSAVGARVTARTGLQTFTREVAAGSGFQSMDDLRVELGLGSATRVLELTVRWPSGCVQTLRDVPADQLLVVVEDCPLESILRAPVTVPASAAFPLPVYATAPVRGPWADPEDVIPAPASYFYQHTRPDVLLRLAKIGPTVRLVW